MNRLIPALFVLFFAVGMSAQRPAYHKLSPMLRRMILCEKQAAGSKKQTIRSKQQADRGDRRKICAFVRISGDAEQVLADNGCEYLANAGDIYIANIPVSGISNLSLDRRVRRIEAERGNRLTMDSTWLHVNAHPAYAGTNLPQAYTGKGVVMGLMDVGFDLTHPNFYSKDLTEYRIKAFWDQLAEHDQMSALPVGADFTTEEALLTYAHSRDGLMQTHGTHTAGIAAGSGYDSPYRGIAYESDLCLVSNAVTQDTVFIAEEDYDKYTYAMDALGFKYIFDYAESQGKPCVISFSEGSYQDFWGNDNLYYEMLERLTGPGRILVASAGNEGHNKSYFKKSRGEMSKGAFLSSSGNEQSFTLKSGADDRFDLRFTIYHNGAEEIVIPVADVLAAADSDYVNTFDRTAGQFVVSVVAYPSGYTAAETCYDVTVKAPQHMGSGFPVSFEIVGNPEVEWYKGSGYLTENALNPQLNAGEQTHNILSPGSAPCVICVGANSYRTMIRTYLGEERENNQGTHGKRGEYSSVGPTFDGRMKPDVMAPGTNVISSYSSYYEEANPTAWDVVHSDVAHFKYNGRTYAWNSNAGTSMSAPVVGGAIALWLQAKPDLTYQDVLGVISRTSSHYDESLIYPNNYYGYGQIDVYRGLLDILGVDGIEGISKRPLSAARIRPMAGKRLCVSFAAPAAHGFSVSVYNTGGSLLRRQDCTAGQTDYFLDMPDCPAGVYVVQLTSSGKGVTGSTLIRI